MRAKSEIIETLSNRLNDDIWKKIKNSLLGRELLAFGAEVISENENVKDTMLLQMNPETADKNGLYLLSQMNEIPITNIKPSCVVVKMSADSKTYAPYELEYHVGNVHFTNIEYTMRDKSVSLINGTYKSYTHGRNNQYGEEVYFYDGMNSYYGIKLGNAYPDSIVATDENGIEIPRYSSDIALSNTVGAMCKVVTGGDGNIFVRFVCSEGYEAPYNYKIEWLDHSAMEFDVEDNEVRDGSTVVGTVEYFAHGVVDDLGFMRLQLKKEMAKYNGFNTPSSVERYVRGLPYVLDAKCDKSEGGINVYVKPTSLTDNLQTYLDFSEVAAHISLNSILFPNIKVKAAEMIKFGIEVSGVYDEKLQHGIADLLQKKYSYENMTFNTVINTGSILSEIYAKFGVVPTINITIKEPFANDKPLKFKPIKNSLKLYGNHGTMVAWEENDMIYGQSIDSKQIPFYLYSVVASMGTSFLLMQGGKTKKTDRKSPRYNDTNTGGQHEIDLCETIWDYSDSAKGYNRFYVYNAQTNTLKPFDISIQNLIYSDENPCLKYSSWNTDEQPLGNLYDIKFLSTNNALVVNLVFKNAGFEVVQKASEVADEYGMTPVDWQINDKDKFIEEYNDSLYFKYVQHKFVDSEIREDYQGKFQTTFFVDIANPFINSANDTWQIFQEPAHGDPETFRGLYTGLRNITNIGTQLRVKSNWFVYNNKSYYAYEISDKFVYVTNGVKNLKIKLNGTFLGMIPYESDLYIINENYITRIEGFEGLKEREEIYQIYKDYNTKLDPIVEIMREFDNQIAFKTVTAASGNGGGVVTSYYTAVGFEIMSGNKICFKNIKQIFNDENAQSMDLSKCKMGGCTKDYVTLYEELNNESDNLTEVGMKFYIYDLTTQKTTEYKKTSNVEYPDVDEYNENYQTTEEEEIVTDSVNLAKLALLQSNVGNQAPSNDATDEHWGKIRLAYSPTGNRVEDQVTLKYEDMDNVYILQTGSDEGYLHYDSGNDSDISNRIAVQGVNQDNLYYVHGALKFTSDGDDGDGYTRWNCIIGFFKLLWERASRVFDSGFYSSSSPTPETYSLNNHESVFWSKYFKEKQIGDFSGGGVRNSQTIEIDSTKFKVVYTEYTPCPVPLYYEDFSDSATSRSQTNGLLTDEGSGTAAVVGTGNTKWSPYVLFENSGGTWDTSDGNNIGKNKIYLTDFWGDDNIRSKVYPRHNDASVTASNAFKIYFDVFYKKYTKTTYYQKKHDSESYTQDGDTKEVAVIGYYDNAKNALVNRKGCEITDVRYYTQNPNVANNFYLVLDESEIKFV